MRFILGDTLGVYHLIIGLGVFLLALYVSFSKHGDIVLMNQVVFALLAGTATTFSLATPLTADIIIDLFNVPLSRATITVIILIITCIIYTYALLVGIKGISFLA